MRCRPSRPPIVFQEDWETTDGHPSWMNSTAAGGRGEKCWTRRAAHSSSTNRQQDCAVRRRRVSMPSLRPLVPVAVASDERNARARQRRSVESARERGAWAQNKLSDPGKGGGAAGSHSGRVGTWRGIEHGQHGVRDPFPPGSGPMGSRPSSRSIQIGLRRSLSEKCLHSS